MLIVGASVIFEVVVGSDRAEPRRALLRADGDLVAPHLVDAEVLGVGSKHASAGACFALSVAKCDRNSVSHRLVTLVERSSTAS